MTTNHSVTRWMHELREGNDAAAEQLWSTYFAKMVAVANNRLRRTGRQADNEDAALSAFKSFCFGQRDGRFPQLHDRNDLWPLLIALTAHKCVDLVRRETRKKRGGDARPMAHALDELLGHDPTPEVLATVAEELESLLARLDQTGDSTLRSIATWKLEGESVSDIATRLGCARRTIERKLRLIEQLWDRRDESWQTATHAVGSM